MSKLNQWLTLVANLSVVIGIVFLAVEMRQNTQAIQAQTRDAMTEKQMWVSEWIVTTPELASTVAKARNADLDSLDETERLIWALFVIGEFREWENSYFQFRSGLYGSEDFEPRLRRWERNLGSSSRREIWAAARDEFSPSFRAEIDRIVAELEQAE